MNAPWSDLALARATRDNAGASGATGQAESAAKRNIKPSARRGLQRVRRVLHARLTSFAL